MVRGGAVVEELALAHRMQSMLSSSLGLYLLALSFYASGVRALKAVDPAGADPAPDRRQWISASLRARYRDALTAAKALQAKLGLGVAHPVAAVLYAEATAAGKRGAADEILGHASCKSAYARMILLLDVLLCDSELSGDGRATVHALRRSGFVRLSAALELAATPAADAVSSSPPDRLSASGGIASSPSDDGFDDSLVAPFNLDESGMDAALVLLV